MGGDMRTVLLLQGGGALGAYQAGVYQALDEGGCAPDWIVGTSIGAVNAALIAGNRPEQRLAALHGFWNHIGSSDFAAFLPPVWRHRELTGYLNTLRIMTTGEGGFFVPRPDRGLWAHSPETASVYDTTPLRRSLERFVDFDVLNRRDVRLSVGATSVTRGKLVYFDNDDRKLGPEHVLASSSLPPGLPAVRVDGEPFWDGGLSSNTPLERVFSEDPHVDSLCFAVNLWNSFGNEPASLADVMARKKEIGFSSRFDDELDVFRHLHTLRHVVSQLYDALPEEQRRDPAFERLGRLGTRARVDVVRLCREGHGWETLSKDTNFSAALIEENWDNGYHDARRTLERAPWRQREEREGVLIHEMPQLGD